MSILLCQGNSLYLPLKDTSVQCVVTSPPYWQQRDYGVDQQLGMEALHDCLAWARGEPPCDIPCYICQMRRVFAECWRVLRSDGVMFINVGDSYVSNHPRGNALAYDTYGKESPNSQGPGSAYHDLCDGCQDVVLNHNFDRRPQSASFVSACETSHDNEHQGSPVTCADAVPLDDHVSTMPQSLPPRQAVCSHCANCDACLAVLRSSSRDARLCVRRMAAPSSWHSSAADAQELPVAQESRRGTAGIADALDDHISDKVSVSFQYSTTTRHQSKPLKNKDLCGIPQRLALALQSDGWYWRSDIVWSKKNCMPESVTDRCVKSHEYVFMFSKCPTYFFDSHAIQEEYARPYTDGPGFGGFANRRQTKYAAMGNFASGPQARVGTGRTARSVWSLASEPYNGAHFATMPTALVSRCILAGSSTQSCPQCHTPYQREVTGERYMPPIVPVGVRKVDMSRGDKMRKLNGKSAAWRQAAASRTTAGFAPFCSCITYALADGCRDPQHMDWLTTPVPSLVLDPFSGAGTTVLTARALGRHGVGIELSWEYLLLSRERLGLAALDRWQGTTDSTPVTTTYEDLPLFSTSREA